ncbi:hypothetical protein A2154_02625 [Candidatus Gottesmanbacteria bacterium RBG_16_43_7]|uniref:Uncharacterized protein n=1 Tax=Candidatus Gottesmanbacteria bacterium RBG_16_43_7 TaxID=1798373 RepID=A0A1F5ZCX9_9BACT|nr:MAG: hypothetical protein A2154_02625 [Candidatus Gottesmanbacteria bacterium RBG_16_43_7]
MPGVTPFTSGTSFINRFVLINTCYNRQSRYNTRNHKEETAMTETPTPEQPTTTGRKTGKNTTIIIVVIVLLLLVAGGFAMQKLTQKTSEMVGQKVGEKVAESMIESAVGGKADVDVSSDGMTVKTDEGSFSTGTSLPPDWPKDVPVYPGSTVTYSGTNNPQTGETGYSTVLTTNDDSQKVGAYYTKELPAQGWLVTGTQNIADTTVISATKDDRTLSMAAATEEGKTTITLGVSSKNQ